MLIIGILIPITTIIYGFCCNKLGLKKIDSGSSKFISLTCIFSIIFLVLIILSVTNSVVITDIVNMYKENKLVEVVTTKNGIPTYTYKIL